MPNWCANTVTLEHKDPAMIARALTAYEEGKLLNEFIPCPDPEDWYNWNVNNWGTKWDIGGNDCDVQEFPGGLVLTFDSAWSPPTGAYSTLMGLGFTVLAMYYEPGMAFAGVWDNGNDDYYEYGRMTAEEAAETLPEELDDAYGISESMAEWEQEQDEQEVDDDDTDTQVDKPFDWESKEV